MTILALEFSSPQRSVAVLRAGNAPAAAEVVETGGGGTNAFAMIESVLREARLERGQIDAIAVGLGPGSYTGIRVALALAQGWRLARGVKLLGIGSVDCLAAQARAEKLFGRVNVVVDAQRNEIYLAGYEVSADGCREVGPLKISSSSEVSLLAREEAKAAIFIGPEATKWFSGGRILFPRAAMVAELAGKRGGSASNESLEPIYLRETHFVKSPPRRAFQLP